ncbi:MAG: membrane dipeptidase [Clostridiales bacterium]|nr:membrane dipeptidase [Clostridiales bacterium]
MKIIDLHCDTLTKLAEDSSSQLRKNQFSIDIEKLQKSNYLAQFFAAFVDKDNHRDPFAWALKLIEVFKNEEAKNKDKIKQAYSYEDLVANEKEGKISCFLSIEEGAALKGSLDNLLLFYQQGVRLITLTWNYPNEIGYPNAEERYRNKGLTAFGFQLIEAMNDLGIIIDVSHLSDKGFWDVASQSKSPFLASHSNARAIRNHSRNLSDEMIRTIAEKGGLVGINFYSNFLGDKNIGTIQDIITHIRHMKKVGGIDILALGSDFDGISTPVEFEDCSHMDQLYYGLLKSGFSEDEVDKIFYSNALSFIKEIL